MICILKVIEMRILFYINTLNTGGAERVLANLANSFDEDKNDVLLVTSFPTKYEYKLNDKIKRYNLDKSKHLGRIRKNIERILALRMIIKKENPDIVVSFMAEANARSILATIGRRTKCLISVRNDPRREYSGILGKMVGKLLLPLADGCVFQTEDARLWFPKKLQNKSMIIYNAVKKEFFLQDRQPVENLIVTCGRLEIQKNHKNLINAFYGVLKEIEDARLYIYGEGKERDNLEKFITDLGMEGKIVLKGVVSNVPKVLSEADLFVLSSDYEGMPNALLEALVMGIPSISTDCPCGGPRMLIEDGKDGILVKVGSSEELKNAMLNVLRNSSKKNELSKNAKNKASIFQPEKIYTEWKSYIEDILGDL